LRTMERQIASMLEKVLSEDEFERATTISESSKRNSDTSQESEYLNFQRQKGIKRQSLFSKVTNNGLYLNNQENVPLKNKRHNTITYKQENKQLFKNNYDLVNQGIFHEHNFLPNDLFSLQLRLKLSSDENPSNYYFNIQ